MLSLDFFERGSSYLAEDPSGSEIGSPIDRRYSGSDWRCRRFLDGPMTPTEIPLSGDCDDRRENFLLSRGKRSKQLLLVPSDEGSGLESTDLARLRPMTRSPWAL